MNEIDAAHGPLDADLVDRVRSGDEGALATLVRRHQDVAFRVALGVVADDDLAADAVQNAWIHAMRAIDRFRGDARFRTWFLSIVVNEARTLVRARARRREQAIDPVTQLGDTAVSPERQAVVRDEADRAARHLRALPEKQRLAVQLRIHEGLSFREVGEAIRSSEGAARVNYHHGIRKLREMMNA